jgi:hypothetical protein
VLANGLRGPHRSRPESSAGLRRQLDDDPFRAADVAEPTAVFIAPASSALGLAIAAGQPRTMMSARTGIDQFGYLLGALLGSLVLSHGGYAWLGVRSPPGWRPQA